MADTKVQNPATEHQTGVAQRQEYRPARDTFSFSPFAMMRRLTDEMDRAFSSTFGLTRGISEQAVWAPAVEVR